MVQIKDLQQTFGFAVIFVTHDMSLISHFSDRLMVMYAGQVDELGATKMIFDQPMHPYTQDLLEAFPSIRGPRVPLRGIPGNPPDLSSVPDGCRFHPRCPHALDRCTQVAPSLSPVDGDLVRCLRRQDAIGFQRDFASLLGVSPDRVSLGHVGLNHLTWERSVSVDGVDVQAGRCGAPPAGQGPRLTPGCRRARRHPAVDRWSCA